MERPLILDFKINRSETEDVAPPFNYDYDLCLNVICINGDKKIFIDLNTSNVEASTKTRVHRENDDDMQLLELMTKTKVHRETDDTPSNYLELSTKTFVKREQDDEDPSYHQ